MLFLDAPQHGGIPCRAGLGVKKITRFVEFPEECGVRQMFVVQHEDGSTWLFEGNSQRMTGLRAMASLWTRLISPMVMTASTSLG